MTSKRHTTKSAPAEVTGGLEFTGSDYSQMLAIRLTAMHGNAEGTVDDATKNKARAAVRNARKAIQNAGFSVDEWRELEKAREAALVQPEAPKAATPRKPRTRKVAEPVLDPAMSEDAEGMLDPIV